MNSTCCVNENKPTHRVSWGEKFRVWCQNFKCRKTARAYRDLCKALNEDPAYRQTWLANISMPIYDATRPKCYCDFPDIPKWDGGVKAHGIHCEQMESETIPRRFECREMSIEQSNYIAEKILKHLFNSK